MPSTKRENPSDRSGVKKKSKGAVDLTDDQHDQENPGYAMIEHTNDAAQPLMKQARDYPAKYKTLDTDVQCAIDKFGDGHQTSTSIKIAPDGFAYCSGKRYEAQVYRKDLICQHCFKTDLMCFWAVTPTRPDQACLPCRLKGESCLSQTRYTVEQWASRDVPQDRSRATRAAISAASSAMHPRDELPIEIYVNPRDDQARQEHTKKFLEYAKEQVGFMGIIGDAVHPLPGIFEDILKEMKKSTKLQEKANTYFVKANELQEQANELQDRYNDLQDRYNKLRAKSNAKEPSSDIDIEDSLHRTRSAKKSGPVLPPPKKIGAPRSIARPASVSSKSSKTNNISAASQSSKSQLSAASLFDDDDDIQSNAAAGGEDKEAKE